MVEKSNMKVGIIAFVIILVIGSAVALYTRHTKEGSSGGVARFYYLITDNGEINYSLENSQGVIVTQLADDSIRVVQPDGKAYMFRNDILLETTDVSPFKIMETIRVCVEDGTLKGAISEVMQDGSERLKVEIEGVKEIRGFYNLISTVYSDTQVSILNNMLKVRGADKAVLEFDMLSAPDGLVYILVNYHIGSSVFNVWRVEGRYVKEIADWSLGFDWSDIDINSISDEELSSYVDRLVQVVNDVIVINFDVEQPTIKEE